MQEGIKKTVWTLKSGILLDKIIILIEIVIIIVLFIYFYKCKCN